MIPFPATHLSILERLRGGDPQVRHAAFEVWIGEATGASVGRRGLCGADQS